MKIEQQKVHGTMKMKFCFPLVGFRLIFTTTNMHENLCSDFLFVLFTLKLVARTRLILCCLFVFACFVDSMNFIEFGEKTRTQHYLLDPKVVYVNHGSYGPCPRFVFEELRKLRLEQEMNPDLWFRITKHAYYAKSIRAASQLLNCDFDQITIVDNATVGVNAILKSNFFPDGGTILCTSLGYGAVLFTVEETAKQRNVNVRSIEVKFPIETKENFIKLFENELKKYYRGEIRLAVIDHITSSTAMVFPIEELTELFHRHGILVLVDGAHGPGQISPLISLRDLKCDFYVGTFHKWLYGARGSSFLFVRDPSIRSAIEPANTSWGYHPTSCQLKLLTRFHLSFFHQGTRDESAHYVLPKSFEFIEKFIGGVERFQSYNSNLSRRAQDFLEKHWKTGDYKLFPKSMEAPFLKMVRLPKLKDYRETESDASRLIVDLMQQHRLVTIILCVQNELYVRIATQIFNTFEDYVFLAETIDRFRADFVERK